MIKQCLKAIVKCSQLPAMFMFVIYGAMLLFFIGFGIYSARQGFCNNNSDNILCSSEGGYVFLSYLISSLIIIIGLVVFTVTVLVTIWLISFLCTNGSVCCYNWLYSEEIDRHELRERLYTCQV